MCEKMSSKLQKSPTSQSSSCAYIWKTIHFSENQYFPVEKKTNQFNKYLKYIHGRDLICISDSCVQQFVFRYTHIVFLISQFSATVKT